MAGVIVAVILTLLAAGGGTVYASQGSLPGDTLYPLKLTTEQVRMALPGDDTAKMERALAFVDVRIEEMDMLAEQGRAEDMILAAEEYGKAMNTVQVRMKQATDGGSVTDNVTAIVAEATTRHLRALDELYDMVPDKARPAVAHARDRSQTGHLRALNALAQDHPGRAIEINLAAIEERLTRARNAAQDHDEDEVADALARLEEMSHTGALIAAHASHMGAGEEAAVSILVAGATFGQLRVLDDITDMVTGDALQAVVRARYEALYRHRETLMDLAELDPLEATEINLRTMEGRLDRMRSAFGSGEAVEVALEQFDAMGVFGEEISKAAQRIGIDEVEVEYLIAMATLLHVETLAEVWEVAPEQAREAIEIVMARALIRHENRTQAMERRGAELPGQPAIPAHVHERVEERIRQQRIWDEREGALLPGILGGVPGCPGCRRP